jgi:hypothetical protein
LLCFLLRELFAPVLFSPTAIAAAESRLPAALGSPTAAPAAAHAAPAAASASAAEPAVLPSRSPAPAPAKYVPPFDVVVILLHAGPNAVGWSGSPPHTPGDQKLCIDPAPFGAQCTMHARDAVHACLSLPGCAALTCPDPAPYLADAGRGISGPVCQARSVPSAAAWLGGADLEAGHGMCAPAGCASAFLVRVPSSALRPEVAATLGAVIAGSAPALRFGGGAQLVAVDASAGALAAFFSLGGALGVLDGDTCCGGAGGGGAWLLREGAAEGELLAPAGAPPWASLSKKLALHFV